MHQSSILSSVARGAAVNLVGLVLKAIETPLLYVVLTRLYGKAPVGLFFIAYGIIEILGGLTISGFIDGVVLYASRYIHKEEDRETLIHTLRAVLFFSVLLGVGIVVVLMLGAPWFVSWYYPDHPALGPILQILALTLPFEAVSRILVNVSKAKMVMFHDVLLMGVMSPLFTIALAFLFHYLDIGSIGISLSFAMTYVLTLGGAVYLLSTLMDVRPIFQGMAINLRPPKMASYIFAQNLNVAVVKFNYSLDVLMLAGFGVQPGKIAFYSLGSQVIRNIRQIRQVFSGSFSPVIARFHHEKRVDELDGALGRVSAWTTALALPVIFVMCYFRRDLMQVFDSTFTEDPTFMLVLAINPFLSCTIGLFGNVITMTGHSTINIINGIGAFSINALVNWLLVPHLGLLGAAIASVTAGTAISVAQVFEARVLVGVHFPIRALLPPLFAGMALFLWPFFLLVPAVWLKIALSALLLGGYSAFIYYWSRIQKTKITGNA
ncbi:oligosaccharide flippase family protein [Myxococcota bacterium]|nr:oligosaccharide flippase family protein [Myxococcota bacterium]